MRIALVNYRYFIAGGPERYLFNIKQMLERNGHTVIPFSVINKKNIETKYKKYFLSSVGDGSEVYFADTKKRSIHDYFKGLGRMIYSFEAKKTFEKFLKETKPDIVYVLYYQNKISCSIVDAAYSLHIPVVQRISDYSLICPCSILYRYHTNLICEKCLNGKIFNSVKYKCVYNSTILSLIKTIAIKVQKMRNTNEKISAFVFPSRFTLNKFRQSGFSSKKMIQIPTFFNESIIKNDIEIGYGKFALYIGRIDPDKGLLTMIDAFVDSEYALKIIGFSGSKYDDELKTYLEGKKHKIEFLGRMEFDKMKSYLAKCLFTIIPSEWYDNLPNTMLESFAMQKCVIATDIGSLKENVVDGYNGLLFDYKNSTSLKEKVEILFSNPEIAITYGKNAKKHLNSRFNGIHHYSRLIDLFNKVVVNA